VKLGEGVYPQDKYGIVVIKIGGEFHFRDVYTNYGCTQPFSMSTKIFNLGYRKNMVLMIKCMSPRKSLVLKYK
jgi:hypothetical protein